MPEEKQKKGKDNVIFIGQKPFMNYVTAVIMQFTTKGTEEVIIQARGKFISKAVDVSEVAVKRFFKDKDMKVKSVKTGSEEFTNREGRKANVSIIEIVIGK